MGVNFYWWQSKDTRNERLRHKRRLSEYCDIICEHNDSMRTKKPKLDTIVHVSSRSNLLLDITLKPLRIMFEL